MYNILGEPSPFCNVLEHTAMVKLLTESTKVKEVKSRIILVGGGAPVSEGGGHEHKQHGSWC